MHKQVTALYPPFDEIHYEVTVPDTGNRLLIPRVTHEAQRLTTTAPLISHVLTVITVED